MHVESNIRTHVEWANKNNEIVPRKYEFASYTDIAAKFRSGPILALRLPAITPPVIGRSYELKVKAEGGAVDVLAHLKSANLQPKVKVEVKSESKSNFEIQQRDSLIGNLKFEELETAVVEDILDIEDLEDLDDLDMPEASFSEFPHPSLKPEFHSAVPQRRSSDCSFVSSNEINFNSENRFPTSRNSSELLHPTALGPHVSTGRPRANSCSDYSAQGFCDAPMMVTDSFSSADNKTHFESDFPDFGENRPSKYNVTAADYDHKAIQSVQVTEYSDDWTKIFPWEERMNQINLDMFGNRSFRPTQREVINAALANRDLFVMMPTGGGKSLCFQLASLCSDGCTVVVMPLLSLMQDQVDQMNALGIEVRFLCGTQDWEEQKAVYDHLRDESLQVKLLYVTPEKLKASNALLSSLHELNRNGRLNRFAIDEAHCVSQWGNDFRPDYTELKKVRKEFPNVPMMALTATATEEIMKDVINQLGLQKPEIFSRSFDRPNLRYIVRKKTKAVVADIAKDISTNYRRQSGIVYCLSKKECEKICEELQSLRIDAGFYHGGVKPENRQKIHREWMNDEIKVICATVAFGMGINKPDVRFIYHVSLPKCIENYYQESGRAGRDGNPATCVLYYDYSDKSRQQFLIHNEPAVSQKKKQQRATSEWGLNAMIVWCENPIVCRRKLILEHFGETFRGVCQEACDNCQKRISGITQTIKDVRNEAQALINLARNLCLKKRNSTVVNLRDASMGLNLKKIGEGIQGSSCLKKAGWIMEDTCRLLHLMLFYHCLTETVRSVAGTSICSYLNMPNGKVDLSRLSNISFASKGPPLPMGKPKEFVASVAGDDVGRGHKRSRANETQSKMSGRSASNRPAKKAAKETSKLVASPSPVQEVQNYIDNDGKIERLRARLIVARKTVATEKGIQNASSICSIDAIDVMARTAPVTIEDLKKLSIPGFASITKIEKYGKAFVMAILEFLSSPEEAGDGEAFPRMPPREQQAAPKPKAKAKVKKKFVSKGKPDESNLDEADLVCIGGDNNLPSTSKPSIIESEGRQFCGVVRSSIESSWKPKESDVSHDNLLDGLEDW
eukprot:GHVP01057560.1.p1 GENE.GHVP01057560.1~~GHVP01057560.1.p1  ORF type:complete len:1075 (+),score=182.48 GHVP01057560.1:1010-4234(+)